MESLETAKKYKEEKRKILTDSKLKLKLEKSKVTPNTKVQLGAKKVTRGVNIPKEKKKNETKLKKKKRIELLKRAKAVVYARDRNICQHCGVNCIGSNRHASHVIPVSATGRLALYPLNMKVMCYHCHINWRHKNPIEAGERFANKFPERLKDLKELKLYIPMGSITLDELDKIEEMINILEKSLAIRV